MNTRRKVIVVRWFAALGALAGIVLAYRFWLHVNQTTVALSLLLLILLLAAEWGLRYAVVISLAAAASYNFFFLPPIGTFTIADPQNWLTLFAFLATAIIASRLAHKARNEAAQALAKQRELEILVRLSRELLRSESVASLLGSIPSAVASVTGASASLLYLLEGDRVLQAGADGVSTVAIPHLHEVATHITAARKDAELIQIPIRTGVRPKGLLQLSHVTLPAEIAEAIGGLISLSLDRAQALEVVARSEAAKESERLRSLMIDSITHELRTPLTSIKGAATTLLSTTLGPELQQDLLSIIDEECDRLNKLVAEAVEMAQLDAQQVHMHFEPVPVTALVREALEACPSIREAHPIRVDVPDDLLMQADLPVLQKVLCNLLENAAKYSAPGSPIIISAQAEGDRVAVSVADRGTGIDPGELALIFERFYRSHRHADGTSGTGMGLAISRAIAEAHQGDIAVTSQPGQGSVFTLRIPAADALQELAIS